MELTERERRAELRVRPDERWIDAEAGKRLPHVVAEAVGPDLRHDRGASAETCGRDGDVGGRAAEHLPEGPDLREWDADLLWVEVDGDPPHRQHLRRHSAAVARA